MSHTVVNDFDRFGFTRHDPLPSSTATAAAPLALVSAPQATFEVTTLADVVDASDGVLSLREAITLANDTPGSDTITFAENLRGGTIALDVNLGSLRVTDDLVIDGDPADGGPSGLTIQAEVADSAFNQYFSEVLAVRGAALQLEDLSLRGPRQLEFVKGIEAIDSQLGLERVDLRVTGTGDGTALAIRTIGGTLDISDSLVRAAASEELADILLFDGTDVAIRGGAFYVDAGYSRGISGAGTFRMVDSIVDVKPFIDGVAFDVSGTVVIERSTFAGNTGGYFPRYSQTISMGGDVTIVNSTFASTRVPSSAVAGLYFAPDSRVSFVNSTLTGTEIYGYGSGPATGMRIGQGAIVRIANSIIDDSIDGAIVSNGANTFRDMTVMGATATDRLGVRADDVFAQTTAIGTSGIRAGVLADNGGPTQTVALRNAADNPAIDAADPADAPAFDQRGFPRDATPDIGAFELGPTTLPPLVEGVRVPDSAINGVPRSALTLTGGRDAAISFVDEVTLLQNSLGVYLVGADGEIIAPRWVFERIEHSLPDDSVSPDARPGGGPSMPGDTVLLSGLYDPSELQEGTEFGLFLVADGAARNPFIVFDGGTLDFRTGDGGAKVTDTTPQLVHIAETGAERLIQGDIMHTIDAGSPSPLSNTLNPPASPGFPVGGRGQALSGLLDGDFTIAFEDVPFSTSDKDFNDVLVAVDLLDDAPTLFAAPASGAETAGAVASLDTLLDTVA